MTSPRPSKTTEEIDAELVRSARLERRLLRDQAGAERRLVKAARRNDEAEHDLVQARARLAKAESIAAERRSALDVATTAVAATRDARAAGSAPVEPATRAG